MSACTGYRLTRKWRITANIRNPKVVAIKCFQHADFYGQGQLPLPQNSKAWGSVSLGSRSFLPPRKNGENMMRIVGKYAFPIAAVLSIALGICQAQSVLTHHVRPATQDGTARSLGPLSATQTLNLVITLPLRNQDQLDQLLQNLYDPTSPSYRQFLTVEQFTEQFGPTQQDYDCGGQFRQRERTDRGGHFAESPECAGVGDRGEHSERLSCEAGRLSAPHGESRRSTRRTASPRRAWRLRSGTSRGSTTFPFRIPPA